MADAYKNTVNVNSLRTAQLPWETVGTIDTAGTTLVVAGRAWADVSTYYPPNTASTTYLAYIVSPHINSIEMRFQTTADADAHVVEVWGARGEDHHTLIASLTLTGGTQEGDNSLFFVDTIVNGLEGSVKNGRVIDSAANRICRYLVDLGGYDRLLFLASTFEASSNLRVQVSGY